jgi:hypothetical protein
MGDRSRGQRILTPQGRTLTHAVLGPRTKPTCGHMRTLCMYLWALSSRREDSLAFGFQDHDTSGSVVTVLPNHIGR